MTARPQPARRSVLRAGVLGGATVGVGAGAGLAACSRQGSDPGEVAPTAAPGSATSAASGAETVATVPFRGPRQAGIVTPPQPFASWVGLDLAPGTDREACRRLLRVLTDDIERLTAATPPVTDQEPELAAVPSALTVTVGVGPGFHDAAGLASRRPPWLAALPRFTIDRLEDRWAQTDLVLQVCADSPVAVAHAQRRLAVGVRPLAQVTWVQRGFRENLQQQSPGLPFRNHFGQIDGTSQPSTTGADDALIWVGDEGRDWGLAGGSSMVIRRIRMRMDDWDRADRTARENAVGRRLDTGAPLTGGRTGSTLDLTATDSLGFTVIDQAAHVRRAMPAGPTELILRRPYSYDDTVAGAPAEAAAETGLVFVAFQADPVRQFVPIQQRLAEADLLNLWTTPVGSAVYAVLPGAQPGEHLGQALLA